MDQKLIDQLLLNLNEPGNEVLKSLVIKAACFRHYNLIENQKELNEDQADELHRLSEWFASANFDYILDSDDELRMIDKTQDPDEEPHPRDKRYKGPIFDDFA